MSDKIAGERPAPTICSAAPDVEETPGGEDAFTKHINNCTECEPVGTALVICDEAYALLCEVSD